jgi:hypothetical protein
MCGHRFNEFKVDDEYNPIDLVETHAHNTIDYHKDINEIEKQKYYPNDIRSLNELTYVSPKYSLIFEVVILVCILTCMYCVSSS